MPAMKNVIALKSLNVLFVMSEVGVCCYFTQRVSLVIVFIRMFRVEFEGCM